MCVRCAIPMTVWKPPWSRHSCRKNRTTRKSATRTLVSEISLQRSRMTAIPSALQRTGPGSLMLHLRGHRLGHFRKGLEAVDRCGFLECLLRQRVAFADVPRHKCRTATGPLALVQEHREAPQAPPGGQIAGAPRTVDTATTNIEPLGVGWFRSKDRGPRSNGRYPLGFEMPSWAEVRARLVRGPRVPVGRLEGLGPWSLVLGS